MHRSGTSCLAGSLQSCGLYLGAVNDAAGFNKKGNKEHQALVTLHESILSRVGASWDNPPTDRVRWTAKDVTALGDILKRLQDDANGARLGVKDPRTLILMDGWERFDPDFIGTFRHPHAVSQSLCGRAQAWNQTMSETQALGLWQHYNRSLLAQYERAAFPIISYDQAVAPYNERVEQIARDLGVSHSPTASFRTETLTHFTASTNDMSGLPMDVKTQLNRLNTLETPSL